MAPQHAYVPAADGSFSPVPARDHLSLVQPVYLTFTETTEVPPTGPFWRRKPRRTPAGLAHAAHLHSPKALCGASLESWEALGRSRHPFEQFEAQQCCPDCAAAAGRAVS